MMADNRQWNRLASTPCFGVSLAVMHEMSLIQGMLDILVEEKKKHGLSTIHKVNVVNGALAGAVTDALTFAWEALTPGTEFEGVELVVRELPVRLRCGSCNKEFEANSARYAPCPECDELLGHEVLQGKELYIENIEADVE